MKISPKIKIKRRTQQEWLVWLLIILPFLFGMLNELLHLPWAIRYGLDVAWLVLLLMLWRVDRETKKRTQNLAMWIIVFLAYTLLVYVARYQSALYYLWGVRNQFRVYVAFFAFVAFLTPESAEDYLKFFDKLFWINVAVSLFQYLAMDMDGDHLGGIFGIEKGANGYTNIFFVIVLTKSLVLYLEKKKSTLPCVLECLAALLIAVLAELKFFFVEALLIVAMAVLITHFTWRKFWVITGGVAAIFAGAILLTELFPRFAGWFSLEAILNAASSDKGYTASGDLNRLTAIPLINTMWLPKGGGRLFGLGLGNCDTASFEMLITPFFKRYGHMHYSWMSYAHMYLECGWIGLVFFTGFFVFLYFQANKIRKNSKGMQNVYSRMAMILAVLCIVISVYNNSLRTEAGFMMFFALALPFIPWEETDQEQAEELSRQTEDEEKVEIL